MPAGTDTIPVATSSVGTGPPLMGVAAVRTVPVTFAGVAVTPLSVSLLYAFTTFEAPVAPFVAVGLLLVAIIMRVTGVVTDEVTAVVTKVEVTEPVLTTWPAVASPAVTTCVPVRTQVAAGASVGHDVDVGVSNGSVTTTLVCVTVPAFVAVIV